VDKGTLAWQDVESKVAILRFIRGPGMFKEFSKEVDIRMGAIVYVSTWFINANRYSGDAHPFIEWLVFV
jgi:hypothetical protein